jgi:hypothetical protein
MINENFVYLGVFINLLGGVSYIRDTIIGKIQPNRVSWGLWAVAVFIAYFAEIKQGVGVQSLATFVVGLTPLLIFLASFLNKKAYWKLTKFDALCGLFSVFGIILWLITKNANLAIFFSIFADLMAGIPTLVKSYRFPETENWIEFASSFISVSIAMLTLRNWGFAFLAFPLYIFCYDLVAVILIKFRIGKKLSPIS